ncbi:MAG: O-antigen ligase family protein [Rhodobacteraceae bacterium]|nr:O-antigen ligase family protein [Paracoccaceae bacterium]
MTSTPTPPNRFDSLVIMVATITFAGGVLTSAFAPAVAGVLIVLAIISGLVALPWSLGLLHNCGRSFKIFLAGGGLLTLLMAGNVLAGRSNGKGYEILLLYALLIPLILALSRYLSSVNLPVWRALFYLAAAQMALMVPASFFQVFYLGIGRAHGAINANIFAHLVGANGGLVSVWLFWRTLKRPSLKADAGLLIWQIIIISTLFLVGTRGVIIVYVPLILGFVLIDIWYRRKIAWVPLAFSGIAMAYLLVLILASDRFALGATEINLALSDGQNVGSMGLRISMWAESWRLIKESPVFGYGYFRFDNIMSPDLIKLKGFPHAHNQLLNFWLMLGVGGLIFILLFLGQAMVSGLRLFFSKKSPEAGLALVWLSGGFFVFGLTDVFMFHSNAAIYLTVVLGLLYLAERPDPASLPRVSGSST